MWKPLISMLPSASVPSVRVAPFIGQSASLLSMPVLPAARPWAVEVAGGAARKLIAPTGASALDVCVEQRKHAASEENYAFSAAGAGWLGNGSSTFGHQVKTQLTLDATRVARIDGRAGSPPRGTPV